MNLYETPATHYYLNARRGTGTIVKPDMTYGAFGGYDFCICTYERPAKKGRPGCWPMVTFYREGDASSLRTRRLLRLEAVSA